MYSLLRTLLFSIQPERAHTLTLSALNWLPDFIFKKPEGANVQVLGLNFPHVLGLAAGLDKNGEYLHGLAKLGFSFIELGTVTPKPQVGNPKPRLFRLPKAHALINRMGFNNYGVDALVHNVRTSKYQGILGINIGKNKDTPIDKAADDYLYCLDKVYELASYVTVNISSPNTPDLRQLQQKEYFLDLLISLVERQKTLEQKYQKHVPLLVKVSPDESEETLKQMTTVILNLGIEGVIATNTTCSREGVEGLNNSEEQGGLSGRPLADKSTQCIRLLRSLLGNEVVLIGVGGIDSVESAEAKLDAGADLLQVYTGLIYEGPALLRRILETINIPRN